MGSINTVSLKENKSHGTESFRCGFYQEQSNEKSIYIKHHWHKEIEIIYLENGSFCVEIDMVKYDFPQGGLLFLNTEELHCIRAERGFRESAVVFDLDMLKFEGYDLIDSQLIQPLLNGRMKFPRYIARTEDIFKELVQEYKIIADSFVDPKEMNRKTFGERDVKEGILPQLQIKTALLKILAVLSREQRFSRKEGRENRQVEEIKKILSYIQNNYKEKIYIRDLAGILNVNEQYFCRLFKKVIGKSAMEYVNEIRIKNAANLLQNTNEKVMDICLECGFYNVGNFLKEFKKHTGMTPLVYRKNQP